jgi:hypothetical protein
MCDRKVGSARRMKNFRALNEREGSILVQSVYRREIIYNAYTVTIPLTPLSIISLEELITAQLIKKLPTTQAVKYGTHNSLLPDPIPSHLNPLHNPL